VSDRPAAGKLDLRGVARDGWSLYREHWLLLTIVAVIVLLPQTVLDSQFGDIEVERIHSLSDVGKLLTVPLAVAINLGGEAFYSGVVAGIALSWREGVRHPPIKTIARRIPYLTLIGIDLVVAFGITVGLVLFIIPGLVFGTYAFVSAALVETRGLAIRGALRESFELVRGNFWRVALVGITVYVGTEAASQIASALVHGVELEAGAHLIAEALLEPFQGVATVIVALTLLGLHGREPLPAHRERAAADGQRKRAAVPGGP
jgi:hypothetical protein